MINEAYWIAPTTGFVLLNENWHDEHMPPLQLASYTHKLTKLCRADPSYFGAFSGYHQEGNYMCFTVNYKNVKHLQPEEKGIFLAGDFNGWDEARGNPVWQLSLSGDQRANTYTLCIEAEKVVKDQPVRFKFVTGDAFWLEVHSLAPNMIFDSDGLTNYELHPKRTGKHCFLFDVDDPNAIADAHQIVWHGDPPVIAPIRPGLFFYELRMQCIPGAVVQNSETVFHTFAPRAKSVQVEYFWELNSDEQSHQFVPMKRLDETCWEARVNENLHGAYYYLRVDGPVYPDAHFEPGMQLLDPYALATVSHAGPGIIWDARKLPTPPEALHEPPPWEDLVIVEAHVRDLLAQSAYSISTDEKLGFTGMTKWLKRKSNYLNKTGANCVELQPVQQFDSHNKEEYHWGYMTTNFFSPCAWYALDPEKGSQLQEFRELVDTLHEEGFSVIIDVVYNHVGNPPFLLFLDKAYYFEVDHNGELINWSGCGNTTRASAAMMKRLIIDSLIHYVRHYDIDGFRFDLAELVGSETLDEVATELKKIKPGVVLIAEPWSFRGSIARELKHMGWASWSDGFREFLPQYVKGEGSTEGLAHFMKAGLGEVAEYPFQSINYTESHDDYCWIDRITENEDCNGDTPTEVDRARTHLMFAVLFASLGVPMISAGQDFLRSKKGHANTYQRGDLNALDYNRMQTHAKTQRYVRGWIQYRLSNAGRTFRLREAPTEDYLVQLDTGNNGAALFHFNADQSIKNAPQHLFAINPSREECLLNHQCPSKTSWMLVADAFQIKPEGLKDKYWKTEKLAMPPLSCALWRRE